MIFSEAVASVIRSARDINDRQPESVATEIKEFCKKNKINDIVILGLTYKADVNDFRESPASKIVQFLSFIISLNILAALAVSLEAKDIFSIEEMIFLESKDVISICSTGVFRSFFLLL
jgi:hypothetical protein